jgi:hypothetical protein
VEEAGQVVRPVFDESATTMVRWALHHRRVRPGLGLVVGGGTADGAPLTDRDLRGRHRDPGAAVRPRQQSVQR